MSQRREIASVIVRFHDRRRPFINRHRKIRRLLDFQHDPTEFVGKRAQRRTVGAVAKNDQLNRRRDFLDERAFGRAFIRREQTAAPILFILSENRHRATNATLCRRVAQAAQKFIARHFDQNLNLAVATETTPRVEFHQLRHAGSHDLPRARDHFFFQTTAAERTGVCAIRANQHPRAGSAITGTARPHQRGERERLIA